MDRIKQEMNKGDIGGDDNSTQIQNNYFEGNEISDIGKIIHEITKIRLDESIEISKVNQPYSIIDKINKNNLSLKSAEIIEIHNEYFSLIEEAINCLRETDILISKELFDFYKNVYRRVLFKFKVSEDDAVTITEKSDEIYVLVVEQVCADLKNVDLEIPVDRRRNYIDRISAYVFYKCKFLLPIL